MDPEIQNVETPEADVPENETDRMEAVMASALESVESTEEVVEAEEEPAPEPEPEPKTEPEPEPEPVALTPEEQDDADAKSLGFKNQKANAEFKSMRAELRELRPLKDEIESYKEPANNWREVENYFHTHNISPDQFRQLMTMGAGLNSNDLNVMRGVRDGLQKELANINARLGESGHGYDPLSEPENQDLRRAVEDQEISLDRANELAKARKETSHYRGMEENRRQQAASQREQQTQIQSARDELNSIEAEYRSIDPAFDAKAATLIPILQPIFASIPPNQWASKFREAYRALPAPVQSAPAPSAKPALRNQPLRASALPPGGPAAAASSPDDVMAEAIKAAAALDGVPYRA